MSDRKAAGHELYRQIEAARVLVANFRDVLGDDAQATADMVEGETDLPAAIERALNRIGEIEILETGLEAKLADMKARCDRLKQQREMLRTSLTVALEVAQLKKLETPLATISLKTVPPKCEIIDEAAIPAKYWKPQEPKLDKKAVLDALKAKEEVPGALLSNGGTSIQVHWK